MPPSSHVPEFIGRVTEKGKLRLDSLEKFDGYLRSLIGKPVVVVVKKWFPRRSKEQNAWVWGKAIPMIAEACGYDHQDHDGLYYALIDKCFGFTHNDRLGLDLPNVRGSQMTTAEFSEWMEWIVRFAATELELHIPLPSEEG